jgi:hypothetical protein
MNELQPLLDLAAKLHIPQLTMWMGIVRLFFKWVSGPAQSKLTEWMAAAVTGPDVEEEHYWEKILAASWYRVLSFALDLVLSVKVPTLADLLRLKAQKGPQDQGPLTT